MRFWQQSALFALCAIGLGSSAMANLTFDGTLIEPPPCTINSGNNIATDFGDMGVKAIDGANYRKPVYYTISCSASDLSWRMYLTLTGVATTFESATVQSSVTDLGIKLLRNGTPFGLNAPVLIDPLSPPVLEAVPVKRSGATLGPGGFSASATLLVFYQ